MATKQIEDKTKVHKDLDRNGLAEIFAKRGFNKGVEVGVRWGAYSQILCEANKNLELYAVDPYNLVYNDVRSHREGIKKQEGYFKRATELLKPYSCEIVKKTSLEAVADFDYESIDFVYIDGSHEFDYVMADIIEWGKRVKKGGVISGHDYYNFRHGDIIRAVDNYTHIHGVNRINLTDERTPSWWFARKW